MRKQQIAEYFPCICFQIICHQADRSGVGHVTTKINIQSEPTGTGYGYRSCTGYSYPHTHRFPHYFVTNPYRSGAGHVTTLIYILQGSRAYRSGTGLQLPSYTHRFPHYFVTDSHRSGTGHVTTQIYILQGSRAYRSGTGLQLPPYTQISSLFCHQFPPVRYWSCDNADTGPQSVRYWLQLPI